MLSTWSRTPPFELEMSGRRGQAGHQLRGRATFSPGKKPGLARAQGDTRSTGDFSECQAEEGLCHSRAQDWAVQGPRG